MASKSLYTPELELHESESAKPQPLRIIKRSKTISGGSASGEAIYGGRGGSCSSKGSPPMETNRSLTVHKIRKGRGSILNGSFEDNEVFSNNFAIPLTPSEDPDITPKARRQVPRTMSPGMFLKEEYHGKIHSRNNHSKSARSLRNSFDISNQSTFIEQAIPSHSGPPHIPERRPSKSKNLILRAFGGRLSDPKSIHRTDSTLSKNTLIRRFSRSRSRSSSSHNSSYSDDMSSSNTACSFEPESYDITDVGINSRLSSFDSEPISSSASCSSQLGSIPPMFVLCPEIRVTPEVSNTDNNKTIIWVAIEIIGVLRNAEGHGHGVALDRRHSVNSKGSRHLDLGRYGKLHSMRIDLHPGQGCSVLEVTGNLHESKTIRLNETQLILAKIRLGKVEVSPDLKENSSDELIADLQHQLGETLCSYLTIRLTYKHSAFPNHKRPTPLPNSVLAHNTRIETEATATIKRRNSESAWSPRTSQTMTSPPDNNPLIRLIETHLSPENAKDALRRISDNCSPVSKARRVSKAHVGSSEETVKAVSKFNSVAATIDSATLFPHWRTNPKMHLRGTPPAQNNTSPVSVDSTLNVAKDVEEDPARRIWSEMKLTSRGGRHNLPRASVSAGHYISLEEDTTPTRASSGVNSIKAISSGQSHGYAGGGIEQERGRIMEIALRNKRSVGTETLRSIAPSVTKSATRPKGGTVSGVGLRTWGWGPPWW